MGARTRRCPNFNWMGAFAWLDRRNQRLTLARDAGSEKPLYYLSDSQQFIFASEIKTLLTLADENFSWIAMSSGASFTKA